MAVVLPEGDLHAVGEHGQRPGGHQLDIRPGGAGNHDGRIHVRLGEDTLRESSGFVYCVCNERIGSGVERRTLD